MSDKYRRMVFDRRILTLLFSLLAMPSHALMPLHQRCQRLVLQLSDRNLKQQRQLLETQFQTLNELHEQLLSHFSHTKEKVFAKLYSEYVETAMSQFDELHHSMGLVAVKKLHFDKAFRESANHYAMPYFEIQYQPKIAYDLPSTLFAHRLIEFLSANDASVSINFDPMIQLQTHASGIFADEAALRRPHIFINLSDIHAIDTEPVVLRHEIIHFFGQQILSDGNIIPLRHIHIVPRYHHVGHFFSKDLKSPSRKGLLLDELYAYEDSVRSSFYNLEVALDKRDHAESLKSFYEVEYFTHALDQIYLDAAVALRLSAENVANHNVEAFLEKSLEGDYNYVIPYDFDKNPLAAPDTHSSHAELKYPVSKSHLPYLARMNVSISLKNKKGLRRIPLNHFQRAELYSKLSKLRRDLDSNFAWIDQVNRVIDDVPRETETNHPSVASLELAFEKISRLLKK